MKGLPTPKPLRCAIYTRKSTEQGLEQAFNSLDNQREAAEAYIKSQAHEGWRLLPEAYDDGGYSGGSLQRPALQRLLAEVQAGRIDVIVVYKVDRLTRALSDFAKLVELFDQHGVSFVSVTQAFNTTTSMGRLTLNVLLSFAQFEREVTAERIRDKIAASKRKGLRMGGPVALGYAARDKKLVIDPAEAEQVRGIFARYLELGCLSALAADLRERGMLTKSSVRRDGTDRGGIPFSKGPLAYLLRNRVYIGEVVHKGQHYRGEHEAIVPRELFEAVQAALSAKGPAAGAGRANTGSLLKGLLYDDRGNRMTPSSARKGAVRYRYYVSRALEEDRREEVGSVARVPAPEIEQAVLSALSGGEVGSESAAYDAARLATCVSRVEVHPNRLILRRMPMSPDQPPPEDLIVPWSARASRCRREMIPIGGSGEAVTVMRSETRARLVEGIAKARLWLDDLLCGRVQDTAEIARQEGCSERSVRMTLNLAFLAPDLIRAAVAGTLPEGQGISAVTNAPLSWRQQCS
ncbi:recombinase family protein [Methylobacterium durans]|uniref:Recombinase family protein n=1 Tax=Methylobacterium durans TaxID=2202825 RepID=A0A2U8WAV3_9HYPH|nr:recombinase family protein [Methylobacterium durans]AWN42748.1 recombinase family protein [Methylobacterium durans]